MNEQKHQQLMRAVRNIPATEAPPEFSDGVLRALRRRAGETPAPRSLADELTALFPRLAAAALLVIAAAVAFEFYTEGDFVAQLAEASDQWLLPMDWL